MKKPVYRCSCCDLIWSDEHRRCGWIHADGTYEAAKPVRD